MPPKGREANQGGGGVTGSPPKARLHRDPFGEANPSSGALAQVLAKQFCRLDDEVGISGREPLVIDLEGEGSSRSHFELKYIPQRDLRH